jgi:hypothetical protein
MNNKLQQPKFELGQIVHVAHRGQQKVVETCKVCDGIANITFRDKEYTCPGCHGRGTYSKWKPLSWHFDLTSRVGNIRAEWYMPGYGETEIKYMLTATGVGSGTLWSESNLFATLDELEAECDRRNAAEAASAQAESN